MSTRALVPNASGEGSLGTADKAWGAMYVNTPATGTNDQSVPSTAWVQALVAQAVADAQKQAKLDAHPVGSYYFSDDSTSPATLFGGTWEALPAGYTLIAQGSGTDEYGSFTYTAGQKYGERKHQLTTDELPKLSGQVGTFIRWNVDQNASGILNAENTGTPFPSTEEKNSTNANIIISFGGDKPHENLSPCLAAYGWRRTA